MLAGGISFINGQRYLICMNGLVQTKVLSRSCYILYDPKGLRLQGINLNLSAMPHHEAKLWVFALEISIMTTCYNDRGGQVLLATWAECRLQNQVLNRSSPIVVSTSCARRTRVVLIQI